MDSINQNQSEENHQDLANEEAVKKINEIIDSAKTCFFCTSGGAGLSAGVRPMTVQQVDEEGNCWFLSAKDSHMNQELENDESVELYFQGSAHSDFLHLVGFAEVSEDKQKISELWKPLMKVWFTEGENDPRISVVKVVPQRGYYWDNKHGMVVAGAKMVVGAITGKTLDDSIEGTLTMSIGKR
jgi:general stress protein 26